MSINFIDYVGNYKVVEVSLKTKKDGKFVPLKKQSIQIAMIMEEGDSLLASVTTDQKGIANLAIEPDFKFIKNKKGYFKLKASFKGNKTLKKAKKTFKARELKFKSDFLEQDNIKEVQVRASEINVNNEEILPKEVKIGLYVERLFTDFKIAEQKLKDGFIKFEIPQNISGDENGNIHLKVKIVDNKYYGNIIVGKLLQWGKPVVAEDLSQRRFKAASYLNFMILSIIILSVFGLFMYRKKTN